MQEAKYIYLHIKSESDYDYQDTEDLILDVSTDFQQIMKRIDPKMLSYDSDILIVKNGDYSNRSYILLGNRFILEKLELYTRTVFINDKEEFDHVYAVLKEWTDKRSDWLLKEEEKRQKEKQQAQDKKDRAEYERLKKKFHEN